MSLEQSTTARGITSRMTRMKRLKDPNFIIVLTILNDLLAQNKRRAQLNGHCQLTLAGQYLGYIYTCLFARWSTRRFPIFHLKAPGSEVCRRLVRLLNELLTIRLSNGHNFHPPSRASIGFSPV
jgi:hypothetical protein